MKQKLLKQILMASGKGFGGFRNRSFLGFDEGLQSLNHPRTFEASFIHLLN
jgi:hypothetical protein